MNRKTTGNGRLFFLNSSSFNSQEPFSYAVLLHQMVYHFKNMHSVSWCLFCLKVQFPKYYRNPVIYPKSSRGRQTRRPLKVFLRTALLLLASTPTSYLIWGLKQQRGVLPQAAAPLLSLTSSQCLLLSPAIANKPGKHYLWLWSAPLILVHLPSWESLLYVTSLAGI